MSYTMRRYGTGRGEDLARFVVPIAARTYAVWADAASAGLWAHAEHGTQSWNDRLADAGTHVLVCEREDRSIAACAFVRLSGETAYLGGLYVEDAGRGLGSMLRDERIRISREAGARNAVMFIRETNTPARLLAEKAGFEVAGLDRCARLSTVPRLVYTLALDTPALLLA